MHAPITGISWLAAWPFATSDEQPHAPTLPAGTLPPVDLADFSTYATIARRLEAHEHSSEARQQRMQQLPTPGALRASQGQGLVAALRHVPAPFFQEAFDLDQQQLWEQLQVECEAARQQSLDLLSGYLDIVETHLVQDIAARTDSFFDASGYIQDVHGSVSSLHLRVSTLRQQVHHLEQETASIAQTACRLQQQRSNLVAALDFLLAMGGVAQAQRALQGLLPSSGRMAADYGGAIDVLNLLQGILEDNQLLTLECFRHLPEQIDETTRAVDDLMISDFLDRARFPSQQAVICAIQARLRAQAAAHQKVVRGHCSAATLAPRQVLAEETANPADMAALKVDSTEVHMLDRLANVRDSPGDAAGAFLVPAERGHVDRAKALHEVLLPLVIGLRRTGSLPSAVHVFRDTGVAELKELLNLAVVGCMEVLDPAPVPSDSSHLLAGHRLALQGSEATDAAARLQQLPGNEFAWVLEAVVQAAKAFMNHGAAAGQAVQLSLAAVHSSQEELGAAARDIGDCQHAIAEAVAAFWSKLLNFRARGIASCVTGSSLIDLQSVLELTDALASLVEHHGVRGVLTLRRALQQLCKANLDAWHPKMMSKLTSLLEQEQWVAVEVPQRFQGILDRFQTRANASDSRSAADSNGRPLPAAAATATAADEQPQLVVYQQGSVAGRLTHHVEAEAAAPVLWVAGQPYHVTSTQLLLISMLSDYLAFSDAVPALAAEVAQRVLELVKVFNSRTCQLVLGAGAMQVSGLKSITAKHLAMSCQCLSAFMALNPTLLAVFSRGLPPPRMAMLTADFKRTLQDYRIHHDEVCAKLVSIMRERLSVSIKQLPAQAAAAWPSGSERPGLPPPSAFAATCARQLHILSGVLTPLLLPSELHTVFGRIGLMFSRILAEAYELLEPHGAAWEQQLHADVQCLLNCLRNLPMDRAERDSNLEHLTQLFERRCLGASPPRPTPGASQAGAVDDQGSTAVVEGQPMGQAATV